MSSIPTYVFIVSFVLFLMQMKISSNSHAGNTFIGCNFTLSVDNRHLADTKQSIMWESISYMELTIKSIVYFIIIYKLHAIPGEGNGSPLQCSCLENPMDGGAL